MELILTNIRGYTYRMLKRVQKRVERKEREVQPAKGKKSVEAEDSVSGSEKGEESGSDEGEGDSDDEEEDEDEDDRSELMSMSGEGRRSSSKSVLSQEPLLTHSHPVLSRG